MEDVLFENNLLSKVHYGTTERGKLQNEHEQQNETGNEKCTVTQVKSMQQPQGDESCGYFALFNCITLCKVFETDKQQQEETSATSLFDQQYTIGNYLEFKEMLMKHLVQIISTDSIDSGPTGKYPWTESHIKSGVLERAYLDHILKLEYFGDCVVPLLDFGWGSLTTNHPPSDAIEQIEVVFAELESAQRECVAFLVGATIHYYAVIVKRMGQDSFAIFLLDSQNKDIIGQPEEALTEIVEDMGFPVWLERGWNIETMRSLAMDSFKGIRFVIDLMAQRLTKAAELPQSFLEANLCGGFIGSYFQHVVCIAEFGHDEKKESDSSLDKCIANDIEWFLSFKKWTLEFYPPAVISKNVIEVMRAYQPLSVLLSNKMFDWCNDVLEKLELCRSLDLDVCKTDENFVCEITQCLQTIKQELLTNTNNGLCQSNHPPEVSQPIYHDQSSKK